MSARHAVTFEEYDPYPVGDSLWVRCSECGQTAVLTVRGHWRHLPKPKPSAYALAWTGAALTDPAGHSPATRHTRGGHPKGGRRQEVNGGK